MFLRRDLLEGEENMWQPSDSAEDNSETRLIEGEEGRREEKKRGGWRPPCLPGFFHLSAG